MELNSEEVAEQIAAAMLEFGDAINLHLPIPVDLTGLVERTASAAQGVVKLHAMLRDQPLEETVALVAHGFLDAWNALVTVGYDMTMNEDPDVREAAKGSYFWLCGQLIASIEFLKDRANGA